MAKATRARAATGGRPALPKAAMPLTLRWIPLADLAKDRVEWYVSRELAVPSFDGWQLRVRTDLIMGVYAETMDAMQAAAQVDAATKEDPDWEPTVDEAAAASATFGVMIRFCQAHAVDWNFVKAQTSEELEAGAELEALPYSDEAWLDFGSDLITACFTAIQNQVTTAPKETG